MAKFVVCASPLVRVFLSEWHDRLLDNPELLESMEDFSFSIAHGIGAFKVDFNKPMMVQATTKDDDVESRYNWLIGEAVGSAQETDIYGLVPFETSVDLVQRGDEMARLSIMLADTNDPKATAKIQKEIKKIQDDTTGALAKVRTNARELSAFRIKRALKRNHNFLIREWQRIKEAGGDKYPPSMTELFGMHVLNKEIKANEARGAAFKKLANEAMGGNFNV